jgi:phosphate transport system substrate-binding protein
MTRVPVVRAVTLVPLLLAACGGDRPAPAGGTGQPTSGATLTGAGATFPNPIYAKWFDLYAKQTGVRINYQSIGSGGGIRQFIEGTVDFGATDGPMSDEQIRQAQGNVVHLPTVLGAVVLTYNLPALKGSRLNLDAATVASIFLGRITKWNAPEIAALNPGVTLPDADLVVVHRSDGSGTSYIFTDYLSKLSPEWARGPGRGTSVNWPVGLGGKGNEGVTQQVKQTEGALGYVELVYAVANSLPYAGLRNAAGRYVEPGVGHQRSWRRRLSDRVVHLAAGPPARTRPSESQAAQGLPHVDADPAGPAGCDRSGLCAAARERTGDPADPGRGVARTVTCPLQTRDRSPERAG